MATPVWKGHLTFGLVSIPVKLCRAARSEKVSFRQVHEATGTRVRQALWREPVARYHGRFHRFEDVRLTPRPPDSGPPIWVGAMSEITLKRAGRIGDGWISDPAAQFRSDESLGTDLS